MHLLGCGGGHAAPGGRLGPDLAPGRLRGASVPDFAVPRPGGAAESETEAPFGAPGSGPPRAAAATATATAPRLEARAPRRVRRGAVTAVLLPDAQLLDQGLVAPQILRLQVVQQAAALADHLQQAAAAVVILLV